MIAFAVLILVVNGARELVPAIVLSLLAAAMIAWTRRPGAGQRAFATSLVLAALFSAEQVAYVIADIDAAQMLDLAGDAFGLAAGLAAATGSAIGISAVRRARARSAERT